MKKVALSAALLLAGCQQAARVPAEPAAQPIATAAELAGEYRVAGIDGSEIDLPHAVTASIDEGRIHVVSDCVNLVWNYTLADGLLTTETAPSEGCARGFDSTEQALLSAFDIADEVKRTPDNAVEFSGGGHSVTLFSQ